MIKTTLLSTLILLCFDLLAQTPIGFKRTYLISDLKSNNPLIQIEEHKSYFITNQLMYNDFNSPHIQTGYYFDEAGFCNKMIRMAPIQNLSAEIAYCQSLSENQKFKIPNLDAKYIWQEDARSISYIDPKLSNSLSYAIVIIPFKKEMEKFRMGKQERTIEKINAPTSNKVSMRNLLENNKWICIGMYFQETGVGDSFPIASENAAVFNKIKGIFSISNPNLSFSGSYKFVDKESTLICEGYEDGTKKAAKYKVLLKGSKLILSQIQENNESCFDLEFVK